MRNPISPNFKRRVGVACGQSLRGAAHPAVGGRRGLDDAEAGCTAALRAPSQAVPRRGWHHNERWHHRRTCWRLAARRARDEQRGQHGLVVLPLLVGVPKHAHDDAGRGVGNLYGGELVGALVGRRRRARRRLGDAIYGRT